MSQLNHENSYATRRKLAFIVWLAVNHERALGFKKYYPVAFWKPYSKFERIKNGTRNNIWEATIQSKWKIMPIFLGQGWQRAEKRCKDYVMGVLTEESGQAEEELSWYPIKNLSTALQWEWHMSTQGCCVWLFRNDFCCSTSPPILHYSIDREVDYGPP